MTDLVLYAVGVGADDVLLSPVVLPVSGVSQLTHTVGFQPAGALLMGLSENTTDAWDWDIIKFTNDAFAAWVVGKRFDAVFPPDRNPRHRALPLLVQGAHAGDSDSLNQLTTFLRGPDAAQGYFDPYGSFGIIQWPVPGPPIDGDVPQPSSVLLLALGALRVAGAAARVSLRAA